NRILESTAVSVTFDHCLNERLVDHVHFLLAILVLEVHFLAAYNCVEFGKVIGNSPVKCDVAERCLCTPTAGNVYAIYKGFNALLYLIIRKVVGLNERCKVGVKAAECLSACPFVLHDSKEVYH